MDWSCYYMSMAFLTAMKSKDTSTNHGAVIVGPGNEVVSVGFNGLPRDLEDKPERQEKPLKYAYTEHSERNAIYNACRIGAKTIGCTMYITGIPCTDCARAVIQSGIWSVVVHSLWATKGNDRWAESNKLAIEMLTEAGVKYKTYDGPVVSRLTGLFNGEPFSL